jgi:hypothetical protein
MALAQQRTKEAGELYVKAVTGYCTLGAGILQNNNRRQALNADIARIIQVFIAQKRPQDALAVYQQTIDLYSRLCEAVPAEAAFAEELTRLRSASAELAKQPPSMD